MALKKYNDEQIQKMSMIELATLVLADHKKEMNFAELFQEVAKVKRLSDAEKQNLLATFYTDLNIDGRFMALGSNVWALKRWYPVDQTTEKSLAESRKRDAENEEDDDYEVETDKEEDAEIKEEDDYEDYDRMNYDD